MDSSVKEGIRPLELDQGIHRDGQLVSRDSLAAVPPKVREAAFGLGATKWETISGVILPSASRGIYGAIILGLGRALGETMALAMLIGSSSQISW